MKTQVDQITKLKLWWWLAIFLNLMIVFTPATVLQAASESKAAFIVTPNYQLTPNADLNHNNNLWIVVNQAKQQIGLNIENKSNNFQNFVLAANTAYTGIDGQIHYDRVNPPVDQSLTYRFRDLVSNNDQKVTVPPRTKKSFTFQLQFPDSATKYRGQVLGAVIAYQLNNDEKNSDKGKVGAVNRFAMGFPVALNFGGSEIAVNSLPSPFKLQTVQPGIGFRGGLAILADLRNFRPAQVLDFTIFSKIMPQNKNKVLYRSREFDRQMAPNSIYQHQVYWTAKKGLRPGKYRLVLTIEVPGNSLKTYRLSRNFTITSNEARKLNKKVGIKPNYLIYYIILFGLVLLLLLLLTFLVSRHFRKRQGLSKK